MGYSFNLYITRVTENAPLSSPILHLTIFFYTYYYLHAKFCPAEVVTGELKLSTSSSTLSVFSILLLIESQLLTLMLLQSLMAILSPALHHEVLELSGDEFLLPGEYSLPSVANAREFFSDVDLSRNSFSSSVLSTEDEAYALLRKVNDTLLASSAVCSVVCC